MQRLVRRPSSPQERTTSGPRVLNPSLRPLAPSRAASAPSSTTARPTGRFRPTRASTSRLTSTSEMASFESSRNHLLCSLRLDGSTTAASPLFARHHLNPSSALVLRYASALILPMLALPQHLDVTGISPPWHRPCHPLGPSRRPASLGPLRGLGFSNPVRALAR